MRRYLILSVVICTVALAQKKTRQATNTENLGDDYSDFSAQPVKNGGANHELKQVTYSTIAPKFDIPTRAPLLNPNPIGQRNPIQATTKKPVVVDYQRGYYFQHYPWDRLPRRYLLRPGMTYVYPPQYQYATYRYPYLPYTDHYSIYRTHPGIGGGGCGSGGCGGGGYAQAYQGYSSGCGGGSGTGCGGYDDDDDDESYEDSEEGEGGKSGEAKINKKDPLEDLELEDLEKLSKSDDAKGSSSGVSDGGSDDTELEAEPVQIKKGSSRKHEDDEDLIDDRKKQAKRNFLVKWA